MRLSVHLPWPPSVNHYWKTTTRRGRPIVLLSKKGEDYRLAVIKTVLLDRVPMNVLSGRLSVAISAFPPDRRCRDLDNLFKAILDCLKCSGVIRDDGDIDVLSIARMLPEKGGRVHVEIFEISPLTT